MTTEEKYEICKSCELYVIEDHVETCNNKLYTNGTKTSLIPRSGYKNGCGCMIQYKIKSDNPCPLEKF